MRLRLDTSADNVVLDIAPAASGQEGVIPAGGVTGALTSTMQCGAAITAANGAGNRAITAIYPGGMGGLSATINAPSGSKVLKVFDSVTGADLSANYATSFNAQNQIQQLSGNLAGNSPLAIILIDV